MTVLVTVGGGAVTVDRTVLVVAAGMYVLQNADALAEYLASLRFRRQLSALQTSLLENSGLGKARTGKAMERESKRVVGPEVSIMTLKEVNVGMKLKNESVMNLSETGRQQTWLFLYSQAPRHRGRTSVIKAFFSYDLGENDVSRLDNLMQLRLPRKSK